VATIVSPEGKVLEVGGLAYESTSYNTEYSTFSGIMQGTFRWDGPEAEGTWLDDGLDPDVSVFAQVMPSLDARYLYVDGGLGGEDWAAAYDDLEIYDAALGSVCSLEPAGVISIRTEDGTWIDVIFDGPASDDPAPSSAGCDGCGEAFFRGVSMGAVCADFSAWLAWGETPW
jgi:hypothetical protein